MINVIKRTRTKQEIIMIKYKKEKLNTRSVIN